MLAITLKQRGVEIPRNKGKKIKGKRTRNASLSSCSSWSWSVGAVSLAPMLLTISTNSSKLTFPSPKMTKTKRTHHVHQHRLILFFREFFFGVSQQHGYHLFSNAVLLEFLHFSFFCYNYLKEKNEALQRTRYSSCLDTISHPCKRKILSFPPFTVPILIQFTSKLPLEKKLSYREWKERCKVWEDISRDIEGLTNLATRM